MALLHEGAEFVGADDAEPAPTPTNESVDATPPSPVEPARAASKSKPKPSLLESWESSPEERAAIRDPVLEDYFALADGRSVLSRIHGAKRDVVILDFLDGLGVDGMLKAASPEFLKDLRAKLPAKPNAWLTQKDPGTIAKTIVETVGRAKG